MDVDRCFLETRHHTRVEQRAPGGIRAQNGGEHRGLELRVVRSTSLPATADGSAGGS